MADSITSAISGLTNRVLAFRLVRLIENGDIEMNRLQEKLAKAAGVVQRQSAKIEARADALIAREEDIERQTDEAFAPHEKLLDVQQKGLDDLEASLRLLSNGAPLEPSTDSPAALQPAPSASPEVAPASQQAGSTASTEPHA